MKPNQPTIINRNDPTRIKKSLQDAETAAFTTQLFYFSMKILFCYILTRYRNILSGEYLWIAAYAILLCINVYFIYTTGRNPGYEPKQSTIYHLEQQHTDFIGSPQQPAAVQNATQPEPSDTHCSLCNCRTRIRMKHCYRCGRCVRKYDHHCPWIGACVGEGNHWKFLGMLVMQTLQACATFAICFQSMLMYQYKDHGNYPVDSTTGTNTGINTHAKQIGHTPIKNNQIEQFYNAEFGVFAIFSLFMFIYILFVGGLMLFHAYLLLTNTTTTQLMARSKAKYLHGVKGNPFTRGPFENVWLAIQVPENGHNWVIGDKFSGKEGVGGWGVKLGKIWSNQYYNCC